MRIVVLGGGFGGVTAVRHLERVLPRRMPVEITLVNRENFLMLTPLLFEACSGTLELRHCARPLRAALRRARFIEATGIPSSNAPVLELVASLMALTRC